PEYRTLAGSPAEEALVENTVTPPDAQVAFRLDFPRWRGSYARRDRRIIDDLMVGERTRDVSRKYGISPARVSQKRRRFYHEWLQFLGEADPTPGRSCVV